MKLKPWDEAVPDDLIYQSETPENGELPVARTKQSFIDLCFGDEGTAARLFNSCHWEPPEQVLERAGGYEQFALEGGGDVCRFIILGHPDLQEHFEVIVAPSLSAEEVGAYRSLMEEAFQKVVTPQFSAPMRAAGFTVHREAQGYYCQAPRRNIRTHADSSTEEAAFQAMAAMVALGEEGQLGVVPRPAVTVLASPVATVSRSFPFEFSVSRNGEPLSLIPGENFTVNSAKELSPFDLAALHRDFDGMRIDVLREPSVSSTIESLERDFDELLNRQRQQGAAQMDPNMHVNWFRQHYGRAAGRCGMAGSREAAYVGPIVGQTRFHYFQLDMVDDEIVRHYKLELPQGLSIRVGKAYAIRNAGGVRHCVTPLPLSVAKRLARDLAVRRKPHPVPAASMECGGPDFPIRVTEEMDDYARFWFEDIMVGYAYTGVGQSPSPRIQPTVFGEEVAQRMTEAGLQVKYSDRGFSVEEEELAAAAYEGLGWYAPPGLDAAGREAVPLQNAVESQEMSSVEIQN